VSRELPFISHSNLYGEYRTMSGYSVYPFNGRQHWGPPDLFVRGGYSTGAGARFAGRWAIA
jgi:hypothetical protein